MSLGMKIIFMQKHISLLFVCCALFGLWSCQKSDDIIINGQFHGVTNKNIVLEELSPSGVKIIDSVRTNSDGEFAFLITPVTSNPTFYNVRYENSYVPLLLTPSESVEVSAVGNIYNNYTVKGSEGSEKMRELSLLTISQSQSLDSISRLYENSTDVALVEGYGRAYGAKYIQLKRSVISFVMANASSLVSIVPLYQPVFGSKFIFDEPTDIIYFRVVADSLSSRYPSSPYVQSLKADLKRVSDAFALDSMINAGTQSEEMSSLPDIKIKDPSGSVRSLSETQGKVVLLDFTSYSSPELKQRNQELLAVYNKFSSQGFEVFQVCVDQNKALWINTVLESRLPWITVNDLQGSASNALSAFNVQTIPTRFLIDRLGQVVGRNQYGDKLESAIQSAL